MIYIILIMRVHLVWDFGYHYRFILYVIRVVFSWYLRLHYSKKKSVISWMYLSIFHVLIFPFTQSLNSHYWWFFLIKNLVELAFCQSTKVPIVIFGLLMQYRHQGIMSTILWYLILFPVYIMMYTIYQDMVWNKT